MIELEIHQLYWKVTNPPQIFKLLSLIDSKHSFIELDIFLKFQNDFLVRHWVIISESENKSWKKYQKAHTEIYRVQWKTASKWIFNIIINFQTNLLYSKNYRFTLLYYDIFLFIINQWFLQRWKRHKQAFKRFIFLYSWVMKWEISSKISCSAWFTAFESHRK